MKQITARQLTAVACAIAAFTPAVAMAQSKGITLEWSEVLGTAVYGTMGIVLAIEPAGQAQVGIALQALDDNVGGDACLVYRFAGGREVTRRRQLDRPAL